MRAVRPGSSSPPNFGRQRRRRVAVGTARGGAGHAEEVTVYSIQPGRGFEQATVVLPTDYAGGLPRDGYSIYRRCQQALHQTCLAHLLRRCREMIEVSGPAAVRFPQTVKEILQQGLQLRDLRDEGEISNHGFAVACGRSEARLDRVLESSYRSAANERLANHLRRERDAIFTVLYCEGLDATDWRAEQAIRPAVVARKLWGGNRTPVGAHTQEILTSVLQTCRLPACRSFAMISNAPRSARATRVETR